MLHVSYYSVRDGKGGGGAGGLLVPGAWPPLPLIQHPIPLIQHPLFSVSPAGSVGCTLQVPEGKPEVRKSVKRDSSILV